MGVTLPIFKSSGKTFVSIQALKISASDVVMTSFAMFRALLGIWNNPVDFPFFNLFKVLKTVINEIFLNLNFDSVCLTCCAGEVSSGSISLVIFSPVETKCSLNSSAILPFSFTFRSFTFSISMSDPLLSLLMACFKIFHVPFMSPFFSSMLSL